MIEEAPPSPVVQRNAGVLSSPLGDGAVLLDPARNVYLGLNAVAAEVWRVIETPRAWVDVVTHVVTQFDVDPDSARLDLDLLFEDLRSRSLIEVVGHERR